LSAVVANYEKHCKEWKNVLEIAAGTFYVVRLDPLAALITSVVMPPAEFRVLVSTARAIAVFLLRLPNP
jgi:hypothetical protein